MSVGNDYQPNWNKVQDLELVTSPNSQTDKKKQFDIAGVIKLEK